MGIFGARRQSDRSSSAAPRGDQPAQLAVGDADLSLLDNLLTRYERVSGQGNDVTDPVVIAIARAGGSAPLEEIFEDVAAKRQDPTTIHLRQDRPWYWMQAVAEEAFRRQNPRLAARIASFIMLWAKHIAPILTQADLVDLGIMTVPTPVQAAAAAIGMKSASALPSDLIVASDSTGEIQAGGMILLMSRYLIELATRGVAVDAQQLAAAHERIS